MTKREEIIKRIQALGVVPVIAINDVENAVPLAKALVRGGLPAAEITFRTDCAAEAISRIRAQVPEMLVGAGTVLTEAQVDGAIEAGSEFIVTPGFNPAIVRYAISKGAIIMPGTATPGEMEQAMSLGLDVVKFFPAEQNGGVAKLKAVAAPYSKLRFMPTGGVNEKNISAYLSFDKIIACGGTWMVKKELIDAKNWDEIERLTRAAVAAAQGIEFRSADAEAVTLAVNNVDRAKAYFANTGFKYECGGKLYSSAECAGTGILLTKKG